MMRGNPYSQNLPGSAARYQSALAFHPRLDTRLTTLEGPTDPVGLFDEAAGFLDKAQAKAQKLENAMTWLSVAAGINIALSLVLLYRKK